ncbi:MAG: oxidoreductase [Gammaproteobacteria bacterium]|nr:oxidoreductase [Gammaproteobacteria bacterium]|tara:strand:+ start:3452 stop:4321 length:870 start_codon:yes stop_codon:yes gene_type:complete
MVSVVYEAPDSVQGAVALLAGAKIPARPLAGGTDLIIQLQAQKNEPCLVVDLKKISELMESTLDEEGLHLGPGMACAEFFSRDDIRSVYPGLVEAAQLIGSTQVQGRASVGGNLCNASPAADSIPALIANSASCVIVGPSGERRIAIEDFVTGVGENCLGKGELVRVIEVPRPADGTSDAYLRFIPRTEMDIAVAGVGASITLDDDGTCAAARISLGAVAPTAILVPAAAQALIGTKVDDEALLVLADAASAAAKPISDRRGTAEYRRHVVGVLAKRAASTAAERARGN